MFYTGIRCSFTKATKLSSTKHFTITILQIPDLSTMIYSDLQVIPLCIKSSTGLSLSISTELKIHFENYSSSTGSLRFLPRVSCFQAAATRSRQIVNSMMVIQAMCILCEANKSTDDYRMLFNGLYIFLLICSTSIVSGVLVNP